MSGESRSRHPKACGHCKAVSIPIEGWYTTKFCSIRCKNAASEEPTTCTCGAKSRPNGLGECANCHRLCMSHSWHDGVRRPVELRDESVA